jgi:lipopolysaccharide/colanic/teichoic acid biosynthesis glycosyltransferase
MSASDFVTIDPDQRSWNPGVPTPASRATHPRRNGFGKPLMGEIRLEKPNAHSRRRSAPHVTEMLHWAATQKHHDLHVVRADYGRRHQPIALALKRTLDLSLASSALLLLSPVFVVIAVAIKLQSDGPVFYSSERVGVGGRLFHCHKFRTMVRDAESLRHKIAHLNEREGILFKVTDDPRITPLGAMLRKYSLDELPQLINVLRGEMSLVGPRPSLHSEVVQYETQHFRRLSVLPGMTGLWQVEARSDPSFDSYVALDCRYADTWSLWLDLKILARTVRVVLLGTGV